MEEKRNQEIERICSKWLMNVTEPNFNKYLNECYEKLKDIDFSSPIYSFTKRLEKIPYSFTKSEKVSGSVCYYGAVFTSLLNTGKIEEIEGLFTFALCYMLIDHFLDDDQINEEEKEKSMKEIFEFLINEKDVEGNILIDAAKDRYFELISRNPNCKQHLINLFKSEIKGSQISKSKNYEREVYKKIAEEKGGRTSLAIASIIGLDCDIEDHYILGSLIQTPCDDLMDIHDDRKLGIYTLVQYDIDHGNLDYHIYESMIKIDKLSSVYNFFKIILMLGIVLGIHDSPNCVSPLLRSIISKYDPFDENTSKDSLSDWFHEKLYSYIEEKL